MVEINHLRAGNAFLKVREPQSAHRWQGYHNTARLSQHEAVIADMFGTGANYCVLCQFPDLNTV